MYLGLAGNISPKLKNKKNNKNKHRTQIKNRTKNVIEVNQSDGAEDLVIWFEKRLYSCRAWLLLP